MSVASTIGDVIADHATRDPSAPAIVCSRLGTLSYADLARHIQQVGDQLRAAGIGAGSRVGIALPRGPEAALLSVAVCCTATLMPLNPNLAPAELQAELERIRLDALIVPDDDVLPGWITSAGDGFGLFRAVKAVSHFDDIAIEEIRPVRHPRPASAMTKESWAAIFRTSGTTGTSKRVPVTHENLIEMAGKMRRWLKLGRADRSACIMPIYYNAGFKATLLVPLLIGCSVALPDSTAPQDLEQWLGDLRPTWLTAAPAFLQAVIEKLRDRPGRAASSLRFVLSTASYLPPAAGVEAERLLGVPVVEFYGLCEAGMMTAPVLPPDAARPGSVGRIPEGELAIRDGEVMLRGPSVMPGYLLGDIDGVPSGLEDGWLPSGDLGTVDADGFLTIVGRRKEIINRGGEKISPYDIERALLGHPAVREAAAFAVPHPRLGENVGAAVVLHPDAALTSEQLIDFAADRLAPFQMPRHIQFVESLPVGPTGKISRSRLSQAFTDRPLPAEQPAAPLEILIAEIWRRLLERTDIGLDDDFFEIGGDSLQATEMLLEIEETTRHRIAPSDVRVQLTIRRLAGILSGAAAAKREVMTRVRAGEGTPLFLCHGDFLGWGFYGFRLAELLKGSGPVYLLHSMLGGAEGIETIEDMVRCYLPHMEAAAPTGPVRLAGYCHGGLAALEIAGRLERAGRTIERIVLIDTFSINARPFMRLAVPLVSLASRLAPGALGTRLRRSAMPSLWVLVRHLLQGDRTIARRVTRTLRSGSMRAWDASQQTTYFRAMSRYVPPRIHADVICLLCEEFSAKKAYAAAPWKQLAMNVRSETIPGQHNTCISRHVGELAACLNRMMAV
jgi:acyl-CoA synthetase (AMP-forming)/AMP-acid ligase II/thioesterase domain-containing protein/acyl carrier protein